jgi:hypothetical protein
MESFNEILANGLAFLVLKTIHQKAIAVDYSPKVLASMLKSSVQATRSSDKVFFNLFFYVLTTFNNACFQLECFYSLLSENEIPFF